MYTTQKLSSADILFLMFLYNFHGFLNEWIDSCKPETCHTAQLKDGFCVCWCHKRKLV